MFTKEELEPGAKRVVLEYIANNGIPIAKIFSEKEAEYARRQGLELIIRADNACQWDGFSGIFPSISSDVSKISGSWAQDFSLQQLIATVTLGKVPDEGQLWTKNALSWEIEERKKRVAWYCRGLDIEKLHYDLKTLIQEKHNRSDNLFQHPHNSYLVVISGDFYTVLYDRKNDSFDYILSYKVFRRNGREIPSTKFKPLPKAEKFLREAIRYYDRIIELPKFSNEWTFEMEFGKHKQTGETLVYQVRRFRKKEVSSNFLLPKLGSNILNFRLVFGITPLEGITLMYTSEISAKNEDFSQNITMMYPGGGWEATYPHIALPNIKGLFYPGFSYSHSHGGRESLMKVPFVLCISPEVYDESGSNIKLIDGSKLGNLQYVFRDGQKLKLYSNGIKGKIEIL